MIAGTTNPSGGGAQSPVGAYTKIGNRVFVTFYVGRSYTNSPSGLIYISGLPFTILNSSQNNAFFNVSTYNIDFGSSGVPFGIPQHNTQTVAFYSMTSNAGWGGLEWQNHANGTIFISGHFSNFELMAMHLEKSGINLCAIYRPSVSYTHLTLPTNREV